MRAQASASENLHQMPTGASVTLPCEVFEKMYLNPPTAVKCELLRQFANPTPLCLPGFLMSTTPLSCDLMGWKGADGNGAATVSHPYPKENVSGVARNELLCFQSRTRLSDSNAQVGADG